MEEASELMALEAKDETKPFDEKYRAREILQNLRENEYLSDKYTKLRNNNPEDLNNSEVEESESGSDVMRCALGLVLHKIGLNFYESEETKDGLAYLRKSFDYMESLPD
jgi:hypothetical protein